MLRVFFVTAIAFLAAGVGLAAISRYFLRELSWSYQAAGVVLAIVESIGVGLTLGVKRGIAAALLRGLTSMQLGRTVVGLVFDKMLRIGSGSAKVEIAEANERLDQAAHDVAAEAADQSRLRRGIMNRVVRAVHDYASRRFLSSGSIVDLADVRAELERTIDDRLVRKIRGGARLTTWLFIVGLMLLVAGQTWLLLKYGR